MDHNTLFFQGVFIFTMINFTPASLNNYTFPVWADALGWLMGLSTLAPLPIFALIVLCWSKYVRTTTSLTGKNLIGIFSVWMGFNQTDNQVGSFETRK